MASAGPEVLYVDTSALLRGVLEHGLSPDVERRLGAARYLITSRLSLIESARALHRLRAQGTPEATLADIARELDSLWARCTFWELTRDVCELAAQTAPLHPLRTLDALHLATWLIARRRLGDVALLTTDQRLEQASRIA
ncbi:MAG TPA: type II toxin-antitoxin system VapC family toxin [Longimicrobiales bacterium]|nr:type II toxin-antitoxin system VapC family toxin [Longimicrobiales bacterium]